MTTETEKLRALVASWKIAGDARCTWPDYGRGMAFAFRACANQLEKLIAEQPAAQESVRTEGSVPPRWYSIGEIEHLLRRMSYSEQIIAELAPWFHRHLQASFNKGFEKARMDRPAEHAAVPAPDYLEMLLAANDMLRSCHQVAERMAVQFGGENGANWNALHSQLHQVLEDQHKVLRPIREAALAAKESQ